MKKFKDDDKVTIKDIDAVIKANFEGYIDPVELDNHYGEGTYESLMHLKNHYGIIQYDMRDDDGIYYSIYIEDLCDYWNIYEDLLFHYNDIKLDEDLFKI